MMGHHGRMDPAKMQERMQQRMAQRQAQLKQRLQITPSQESAWTAYVAAMQPPANMQRIDPAEVAKLSTPERIDRMRALRAAHHAEMDKRGEATKTFYAALTPEQQKVFDAENSRSRGAGGQHRAHHRGHHV
jgi:protein CpxP